MSIIPVNNNLIIEPLKHQTFLQGEKETFEEVGIVIAIASPETHTQGPYTFLSKISVNLGDKVYFDSWLCGKFPSDEKGNFFWLVNWADVKAIEKHE